jgi:hypothetical protein
VLGLVAAACSVTPGTPSATTLPCGWHKDDALRDVRSYADVLPNTRFRTAGTREAALPLTPLVVVGQVVDVRPGTAWDARGERVPFDADEAAWRQVRATVTVTEVLGSAGWAATTVTVAFPLGAGEDYDSARSRFLAKGARVLPLYRWEGAETGLWGVGPVHAVLVADVAADGTLTLPCVTARRAARLLAEVPTLEALRAAAAGPVRERVVAPVHLG